MQRQYIDTHAHLNLDVFADDRDVVIQRCQEEGIAVINVGTNQLTSQRAIELAEQYENCYAIVGLHPNYVYSDVDSQVTTGDAEDRHEVFDESAFRELAAHHKVVAIGECGLDYFRRSSDTKADQVAAFEAQIALANELQLPLMIHTRDPAGNQASAAADTRSVYDDVYEILQANAEVTANLHFYAGTWAQAKKFFDLGHTLSFTGVITFAKDYEAVVKNAPLNRIHAETDCPFVAPQPYRGQRAEPWMVVEVYKKIAELQGLDEELVREQLLTNATQQYGA